jgi:hypothetical protein
VTKRHGPTVVHDQSDSMRPHRASAFDRRRQNRGSAPSGAAPRHRGARAPFAEPRRPGDGVVHRCQLAGRRSVSRPRRRARRHCGAAARSDPVGAASVATAPRQWLEPEPSHRAHCCESPSTYAADDHAQVFSVRHDEHAACVSIRRPWARKSGWRIRPMEILGRHCRLHRPSTLRGTRRTAAPSHSASTAGRRRGARRRALASARGVCSGSHWPHNIELRILGGSAPRRARSSRLRPRPRSRQGVLRRDPQPRCTLRAPRALPPARGAAHRKRRRGWPKPTPPSCCSTGVSRAARHQELGRGGQPVGQERIAHQHG